MASTPRSVLHFEKLVPLLLMPRHAVVPASIGAIVNRLARRVEAVASPSFNVPVLVFRTIGAGQRHTVGVVAKWRAASIVACGFDGGLGVKGSRGGEEG
jgi:hypothetical protein